jgi:CheY-like chemotaxis protein
MPKPVLLVAEDNDLDAMLLARLIERCGDAFQMVRVEHGDAAVDYLQGTGAYADRGKFPPADLLLLDLKMPRRDGFGVLRWRQETPAFMQLPVIVFSSSALREDVERAYTLGASSYIVKPSDPLLFERLVKGLHEWWGTFNMTAARA